MSLPSRRRPRTRRTGARSCPTCSTPLATGPGRFCGRCGVALAGPGDDTREPAPTAGPATSTGHRRWGAIAVATFVVVVVAGVTSTAVTGDPFDGWSLSPPSTEVALTDERTGERLTADGERDEESAPAVQPETARAGLRCEPVGCERWRVRVEGGWDLIGAGEGHVALARGLDEEAGASELVVIDARSSEELVRVALPRREDGGPPTFSHPRVTLHSRSFVYSHGGALTASSYDGTLLWRHVLGSDDGWFGESHVVQDPDGEMLLVSLTEPNADEPQETDVEDLADGDETMTEGQMPRSRVVALELSDGAIRWEIDGWTLGPPLDGRVVLASPTGTGSRVHAHALSDGRVLWERTASDARLDYPRHQTSVVLVPRHADGGGDVLADVHTGADVLALGGWLVTASDEIDGRTYLVVDRSVPDDEAWREPGLLEPDVAHDLELLAIDADATVLWRTPIEAPNTGYVWLQTLEDRIVLKDERDGDRLGFDLDDGDVSLVAEHEIGRPRSTWTDEAGRQIRELGTGNESWVTTDGAEVRVVGAQGFWFVGSDPLLVTDGTTLLALDLVATD